MKRIGIAASTISKGNITIYNFYVVLISFLFSLFIFVLAGSTLIFSFAVIKYVGNEIMGVEFEKSLKALLAVCMVALTVVLAAFNLFAILINFKFPRIKR